MLIMQMDIKKLLKETVSIHKKKTLNTILIAIFREHGYIPNRYIPIILGKISSGDILAYFNRLRYSLHPKLERDAGIAGRRKTSKKKITNETKKVWHLGRDYSKPSLSDMVNEARASNGTKKPRTWIKFISVPMGGMNKKK